MKIEDINLYEVNEAFAPVPLAWAEESKADIEKLNVNGPILSIPVSCAMNAVPQIKVVTKAQIIETDLLILIFFIY